MWPNRIIVRSCNRTSPQIMINSEIKKKIQLPHLLNAKVKIAGKMNLIGVNPATNNQITIMEESEIEMIIAIEKERKAQVVDEQEMIIKESVMKEIDTEMIDEVIIIITVEEEKVTAAVVDHVIIVGVQVDKDLHHHNKKVEEKEISTLVINEILTTVKVVGEQIKTDKKMMVRMLCKVRLIKLKAVAAQQICRGVTATNKTKEAPLQRNKTNKCKKKLLLIKVVVQQM